MNVMYIFLILSFVLSLLISLYALPKVIHWVNDRNLVDNPNERSAHKIPTPTMGGIGPFAALVLPMLALIIEDLRSILLVAAFAITFVTGVLDDMHDLSPMKKMAGQFIAALLLAIAGFRVTSLYGLWGVEELPLMLQYVLTIILVIGITNAFNLIDGVDGLTGGVVLINSLIFGIIFILLKDWFFVLLSFGMVGAYLGFLVYNFHPAKIFMGDSGSLVAGFLMVMMGLRLLPYGLMDEPVALNGDQMTLLVVGLLFMPVFDFIRVVVQRLREGKHPMKADKNHAHHLLLNEGLNHKKTSIVLYCAHILLVIVSLLINVFPFYWALALLFVVAYLFLEVFDVRRYQKVKKELNSYHEEVEVKKTDNYLLWKDLF